jgi:hypothetical protein
LIAPLTSYFPPKATHRLRRLVEIEAEGQGEIAMTEIEKLNERAAWLERRMVRVLWLLISATAGFMVAYTIDKSLGWPSILVAIGIWFIAGLILQRQEFKDAPKQIQFIDP